MAKQMDCKVYKLIAELSNCNSDFDKKIILKLSVLIVLKSCSSINFELFKYCIF
jgi:hypothetical protein